MCLLTGIKKLVAKEDIICYKVLKNNSNGTYVTPCRDTKAELNKEIIADNCSIEYNERYNSVGGGFIHALLIVEDKHGGFGSDCIVFEAVIPAGTEFFVTESFDRICARKMFITDKVVEKSDNKTSIDIIAESIIDAYPQNIENDGVAIGDFCMTDDNVNKMYIHRSDYTPEMDDNIIGVVGLFNEDGKPVTISRDEVDKAWCTLYYGECPLINDSVSYFGDAYKKSLNGKELTENVLKSKHYKAKNYPMFQYIANFKTKGSKKGDWYVGAIGELVKLAENTALINVSLRMLNGATLLSSWLWSSSECNGSIRAWGINSLNGHVSGSLYGYGRKNGSGRVRAFAVF